MKGDLINSEIQLRLEEAVLNYQKVSKGSDKNEIEWAYILSF